MWGCIGLCLLSSPAKAQSIPLIDGVGLYENFSNEPPIDHLLAGYVALSNATPIDGIAAMLCTGMSNARQAFGESGRTPHRFAYRAENYPGVLPTFRAPGGCQDARTTPDWAEVNHPAWNQAKNIILNNPPQVGLPGVRADQVRVAYHKMAIPSPASQGYAPGEQHIQALAEFAADVARNMRVHFPNVEIIWFTARGYGGFDQFGLSPEPYAYESSLATKRLIQAQIDQRRTGIVDPAFGDLLTNVPWIGWGPYFWASTTPRSDGLFYVQSDFMSDGVHPASGAGETKMANQIVDWCVNDELCSHFHRLPEPSTGSTVFAGFLTLLALKRRSI